MKEYGPGFQPIWEITFTDNRPNPIDKTPEKQGLSLPFQDDGSEEEGGIFVPKTPKIAKETDPYDVIEIEALESLFLIQNACDDLKRLCRTRSDEENEQVYLKKVKKVEKGLSNLAKLIRVFNEILRRLRQPPNPPPEK